MSTLTEFGSLSWARRDEGRLTRGEKARESLRGLLAVAQARVVRAAARLGWRPRTVTLALADIPQPRTTLVGAAERALVDAPPWLVAHSMRTYLFGWALGRRDGVSVDAELLFTAALLHDLGLFHPEGAACFALRGAERAHDIVLGSGASVAVADRIADAISRHLSVEGGDAEARLLRAGAACDVVGARLEHLAEPTRRSILDAWPRADFSAEVSAVLRSESDAHPRTRVAFLCHDLGFPRLIRQGERRFVAGSARRTKVECSSGPARL